MLKKNNVGVALSESRAIIISDQRAKRCSLDSPKNTTLSRVLEFLKNFSIHVYFFGCKDINKMQYHSTHLFYIHSTIISTRNFIFENVSKFSHFKFFMIFLIIFLESFTEFSKKREALYFSSYLNIFTTTNNIAKTHLMLNVLQK